VVSDLTVQPAVPSSSSASVFPARVGLGGFGAILGRLSRVVGYIQSVANAPLLPVEALMECNALLGRHPTQAGLVNPDPFSTESPFLRDEWPF
jgi:hypothetical protein